jgi:hypothetical protein
MLRNWNKTKYNKITSESGFLQKKISGRLKKDITPLMSFKHLMLNSASKCLKIPHKVITPRFAGEMGV